MLKKLIVVSALITSTACTTNAQFKGEIESNQVLKSNDNKNKEKSSSNSFVERVQVVSGNNLVINEGEKLTISANVYYSDDTRDSALEWASNDDSIVKVNPTTGAISGVKSGVTTITAVSVKDARKKSNITVTVKRVDSIESRVKINYIKEIKLFEGETYQLNAQVQMSDGSLSPNLSWKSANDAVATVNKGLVVASGVGKTTINAYASGDFTRVSTVTVIVEKESISNTK